MEIEETEFYLAGLSKFVPSEYRDAVRQYVRFRLRKPDEFGELHPPNNDAGLHVASFYIGVGTPPWRRVLYQLADTGVILWSLSNADD